MLLTGKMKTTLKNFNHHLNIQRNMKYGQILLINLIILSLLIILPVLAITDRYKREIFTRIKNILERTLQQRCRIKHVALFRENGWNAVKKKKKPLTLTRGRDTLPQWSLGPLCSLPQAQCSSMVCAPVESPAQQKQKRRTPVTSSSHIVTHRCCCSRWW